MILITGGAGYIGSHINKYFHSQGRKTLVFDNLSTGHKKFAKWGEFVQGDLLSHSDLDAIFQKYKISAVIHMAAATNVGESIQDPMKYYINNFIGTLNLLSTMKKFNVSQIVFSSTCAIYGSNHEKQLIETTAPAPINPYGISKWMIEQVLSDFASAYGLKSVSLRYFNAVGAHPEADIGELHEPETHLVPLVLDVAIGKRKEIQIFGNDYPTPDGTCLRDYVHVQDLASAHAQALGFLETKKDNLCEYFNVGTERGYSVLEIVNAVERVTGVQIPIRITSRRAWDSPTLVANSKKINTVLGWRPEYTNIETVIGTAWKWHQQIDLFKSANL